MKYYFSIALCFLFTVSSFSQGLVLNEIVASNLSINTDQDGDYEDWIELYNAGNNTINLNGYGLTDDSTNIFKWVFPNISLQAEEYLLVWASGKNKSDPNMELHTNFSIKSSGEEICLTNAEGIRIDKITPNLVATDLSLGRFPNAFGGWTLFLEPSPLKENPDLLFEGQCEDPIFSMPEGFYESSIVIKLSHSDPESEIRYTLDGSVPSIISKKYETPLTINKTEVLRARAFSDELQASRIITKTYFLKEAFTFPVVSVSSDPHNLTDPEYGIFQFSNPYWESNLFQDWERPMHIQFFEENDSLVFSMDAGVKVHGGLTRNVPGKSLAIMARSVYGSNEINHQIFPGKSLSQFKNIVLRNGGNDYKYAIFRDCFMQSLVRDDMDLDLSGSRPAVVFLNGDYWGIRDIKEKMNEHFIAGNYGLDPDDVDLLEYVHHNDKVLALNGSNENFNNLIDFISENNVAGNEAYAQVSSAMDINNYIQYMIAQVYFDNSDWPGNNIKWWRQNNPESKYRWLLFDTDFGYGLSPFGKEEGNELLHYKHNTLSLATAEDGEEWPNPPHSTFLMRNLVKNESFKHQFINTFCDHLNSTFLPARTTKILSEYKALFEPEIARHRQAFPSKKSWTNEVAIMNTFAELRPQYLYPHIMQQFGLVRYKQITLDVNDTVMGNVGINSLICATYPWSGRYFPKVPVLIKAVPKPGYNFLKWSDGNTSQEREIDVQDITEVKAQFVASSIQHVDLQINEINYKGKEGAASNDWVEIYNNTDVWADISNWTFKDGDEAHSYIIPDRTYIKPFGTFLLCENHKSFRIAYPKVQNISDDLGFGFSAKGEALMLYDASSELVDSVFYLPNLPWPAMDGTEDYSIVLNNPNDDNSLGGNWSVSQQKGGNPGYENSFTTAVTDMTLGGNVDMLDQNYPNPFESSTNIAFKVDAPGQVAIAIYNITGEKVKTLVNTHYSVGNYTVTWNGKTDAGGRCADRVLFYTMTTSSKQQTKKMIRLN